MNSANSANPISIKANHLLNDFVMNISYEKLVEKLSNDFTIINLTPEVKDKLLHMVQNRIDNSIKDTNKLLFYASLKKKIDSDEKDIETVTIKVSDLQKLLDACENNEKQLANTEKQLANTEKQLANTEKQLAITKKQLTTTMNLLRSYINNDSNVNNDSKNNCSSSKQKSEKKFEKKSERQSGWSLKVNGKKQRLNLGNYEDNQCDNTNQCDNNHQNDNTNQCDNNHQNDNNNQNDQCENIYCNQDNQNDNNQCDCFDFVDDIDRDV